MDDYKQLQDEALRGLGAVVVTWNLIDEALLRLFEKASHLDEGPAAVVYGRTPSLGQRVELIKEWFKITGADGVPEPWIKPLREVVEKAKVRNFLVHQPLVWSNGRITMGLVGTPEDGRIEVLSQEGRGFWVKRGRRDTLRGEKSQSPDYDASAVWAHVREAESLHLQLRSLLEE